MLLTSSWRDTRRAVLKHGNIPEFTFRQYLFACQADVLLKLARPQEVRRDTQHALPVRLRPAVCCAGIIGF